jgi:ligand-binding SRPBCC domain-containing protein
MNSYLFKTEQLLPIPIEQAWAFFSSPNNLSKITPPEMNFNIVSTTGSDGNEIFNGQKIKYKVSPLLGIPLHWLTEIDHVETKVSFTDKQLEGPYKKWEHTHTFIQVKGGTMMYDTIHYELPFSYLGKFAHWLFVRKKIENIFQYRKEILENIFK